MSGIVTNVIIVYGTAYVTKQAINYSVYYTAVCVKNFMINTAYEIYYKLLKKDQNIGPL